MVKHIQTIRRLLATNCLSAFDHFVGLMLQRLRSCTKAKSTIFVRLKTYVWWSFWVQLQNLKLHDKMEKQPREVFYKACNFIKKRHQHRLFPVKFTKLLKTYSLKSICARLLLMVERKQKISEADLRGGARGARAHPIFCSHVFFTITLKNYKLCYLKLNWPLIMHL